MRNEALCWSVFSRAMRAHTVLRLWIYVLQALAWCEQEPFQAWSPEVLFMLNSADRSVQEHRNCYYIWPTKWAIQCLIAFETGQSLMLSVITGTTLTIRGCCTLSSGRFRLLWRLRCERVLDSSAFYVTGHVLAIQVNEEFIFVLSSLLTSGCSGSDSQC